MLVLDILVIVGFLIFGAYKLIKKDSGLVGGLFVYLFLIPMTLYGIAQLTLACDNIAIEARVTVAVICMILLVAYFIYGFYEAYRKPTEEEVQREIKRMAEDNERRAKKRQEEVRRVLKENGYNYSEEALAILFSSSIIYNNINYPYHWARWLWHKCMGGLMELSDDEFEERLGYNIQEHTPDEMKPIRYPDNYNIKQALRMGYLAKKGVLITDLDEMKKFLSYYPYCRPDFLESFDLPSPIDEKYSGYSQELKLMNETPIKKDAYGRYCWDYPITKPKINL